MYMTDILVGIVAFMNLANGILLFILIRSLQDSHAAHVTYADDHVDESDMLSYNEKLSIQEHVIQREEDFNNRISKMKQELQAEELHPDVHNLPHNIIHTGTQNHEISE